MPPSPANNHNEVPLDFDDDNEIDEWEYDNNDLDDLLSNMDVGEPHHVTALFGDGFNDLDDADAFRNKKNKGGGGRAKWWLLLGLVLGVGVVVSVSSSRDGGSSGVSWFGALTHSSDGTHHDTTSTPSDDDDDDDDDVLPLRVENNEHTDDDDYDSLSVEDAGDDDTSVVKDAGDEQDSVDFSGVWNVTDTTNSSTPNVTTTTPPTDLPPIVLDDDEIVPVQENDDALFDDLEKLPEQPDVQRIAILGERRTGTFWFAEQMKKCFPNLEVTTYLTRHSHWFQNNHTGLNITTPTVVLPLFLNPYHWVDTMRRSPLNMPNHMNLDWDDFVARPWTTRRTPADTKFLKRHGHGDPDLPGVCQFGYSYNEVVACEGGYKDAPVYELRHDGAPFGSILELRAHKIRNWLDTAHYTNVDFVLPVQYETLVAPGGVAAVADALQSQSHELRSTCGYDHDDSTRAPVFWSDDLDPEYVKWMDIMVNWDVEFIIGYDNDGGVPNVTAPEELHIPPPEYGDYGYYDEWGMTAEEATSYPSNAIPGGGGGSATTASPTPAPSLPEGIFLPNNVSSLSIDDMPGKPLTEQEKESMDPDYGNDVPEIIVDKNDHHDYDDDDAAYNWTEQPKFTSPDDLFVNDTDTNVTMADVVEDDTGGVIENDDEVGGVNSTSQEDEASDTNNATDTSKEENNDESDDKGNESTSTDDTGGAPEDDDEGDSHSGGDATSGQDDEINNATDTGEDNDGGEIRTSIDEESADNDTGNNSTNSSGSTDGEIYDGQDRTSTEEHSSSVEELNDDDLYYSKDDDAAQEHGSSNGDEEQDSGSKDGAQNSTDSADAVVTGSVDETNSTDTEDESIEEGGHDGDGATSGDSNSTDAGDVHSSSTSSVDDYKHNDNKDSNATSVDEESANDEQEGSDSEDALSSKEEESSDDEHISSSKEEENSDDEHISSSKEEENSNDDGVSSSKEKKNSGDDQVSSSNEKKNSDDEEKSSSKKAKDSDDDQKSSSKEEKDSDDASSSKEKEGSDDEDISTDEEQMSSSKEEKGSDEEQKSSSLSSNEEEESDDKQISSSTDKSIITSQDEKTSSVEEDLSFMDEIDGLDDMPAPEDDTLISPP